MKKVLSLRRGAESLAWRGAISAIREIRVAPKARGCSSCVENRLRRVDAGLARTNRPPHAQPDHTHHHKANRDQLRFREADKESIILGAQELDDEALYPGHYTIHAEEPPLGVL